jgi:diketogulonate reductase-like aldo/keto reductase
MNRRELLQIAAAGTALLATRSLWAAPTKATKMTIHTRPIPKSKALEQLPVVGLGTWQTFDIGNDKGERADVSDVLTKFLASGARVIDSSPMYGRAEEVTGDGLAAIAAIGKPFVATKVWTSGKQDGIDQMKRSMKRMRTQVMDLMQIHNLVDYKTHLATLRDWKEAGTIRYLGVTHYQHDQFDLIEKLMKTEKLDFIQIPYSIVDRAAEKRILPTAQDTGTAVLVMQPFESGALFRRVKGKALPALAADLDIQSWAQYFLKFLIGHPAVTCPIPATRNATHVLDNVQAGFGRIPDATQRTQMAAALH